MLLLRCMIAPCSTIGCASETYEVGFTGSTGTPGRYQFEVVADGVRSTCEITLPRTCDTKPTCSPNSRWGIAFSGCQLDGGVESIEHLGFSYHPSALELVVRRDDVVVGEGKVRPVYAETRLSGCETCRAAPRFMVDLAP